METPTGPQEPVTFETDPGRYRHWKLTVDGAVARLVMAVQEDLPLRPGYQLKLNSYDLGVDVELQDAVQRLRFEHPAVRCVVITGGLDRVFCAGANIHMLGSSGHGFKVNFCKFTNETRLAIEDASQRSGQRYLAALNGTCAGGGYELAMACDEIVLVDDGNSAVSLPETPLLAVLPGTGGLTRLVDKRKVRRDRADIFCTTAEGIKGKRAKEWGLVDHVVAKSRFEPFVAERASAIAAASPAAWTEGVRLAPLKKTMEEDGIGYEHVTVALDRAQRQATLLVRGPAGELPEDAAAIHRLGSAWWPLAAFRELDDALCHLRVNEPTLGLILIKTEGEIDRVLAVDATLERLADDGFVREVRLLIARTLRRLDQTARSIFALIEPGSCFAGTLFELALAADRSYLLDDPERPVAIALSAANGGAYPMTHGPTRLAARFLGEPERVGELLGEPRRFDAQEAAEAGLVTVVADDIDYEDEVRLAIEERASLSPDALTGMEANLRFPGAENGDSKIFGRLSAWQNWIFQRPNAVGDRGALTLYGKPERPKFDLRRT
ncbi:MAG TPA: 2,3-epoxybenzoyl-CoA dihydrolase [Candidatus Polarisedimenticolaceae bacterium]|nr:2,3-epoxybenzoyl-CoA dihydrolase [Candidatus Polarisedimenticolaceae bacterium]